MFALRAANTVSDGGDEASKDKSSPGRTTSTPAARAALTYTERPHLRFKTRPHRTYPKYQKARKVFDQFKEAMKICGDLDAFLQDVDTYGSKKSRSRQKHRLLLFAEDIRDRASVGDDGIHHPDGT